MKQKQRDEFLEQAKAHFAADMLLQGTFADYEAGRFRGCSVGCHLHHIYPDKSSIEIDDMDDKHRLVAEHYGYPEWLALLQDVVFEGLPNNEGARWHVQLAETLHALPDEYDWQAALHRVHAAILRVALRNAGSSREAVERVLDLHERAGRGEDVSDEMWSAAESAARSAAELAWPAAESAAESAAWSAARSAARSAAWSAAFQEIRDGVLLALAKRGG